MRSTVTVNLSQRERRAQLETLRLLLLRDGEGCEEGFLSRRYIRLIALEQNLAAYLVQESIDKAPVLALPKIWELRRATYNDFWKRLGKHSPNMSMIDSVQTTEVA